MYYSAFLLHIFRIVKKRKQRKEYRVMPKQRVNVRWRNRLSGETGYVKSVRAKLGHFENTWEQTEAKKYISEKAANNDIVLLNEIGEGKDNDFEIVQA